MTDHHTTIPSSTVRQSTKALPIIFLTLVLDLEIPSTNHLSLYSSKAQEWRKVKEQAGKETKYCLGLQGVLFRYGAKSAQVAFHTGLHSRHLVLISGMSQGILDMSFIPRLASSLDSSGWSLVQPLLSSSHTGYGIGSLNQDAEEMYELSKCLKRERSCSHLVLMGHSTGAQAVVRFIKMYKQAQDIPQLMGAILHSGASDQEMLEIIPDTKERILAAKEMIAQGKEEEILFREYSSDGAPVTARRFLAIAERYGDDDMFSSYFSDKDFQDALGHMKDVKSFVLFAGADQYIPEYVDKEKLCRRMVQAMGEKSKYHIIEGSPHGAEGKEDELVAQVLQFLSTIDT